jgi:hypothetical protein
MREKLIAIADRLAEHDGADINTDCPGSDRVTNWPEIVDAILTTLAEPTHEIILAGLDVDDSVQRFWPKMVLAIKDELYADHVRSGK